VAIGEAIGSSPDATLSNSLTKDEMVVLLIPTLI